MDRAIIVYIKADYIYKDIVEDVETRFDNSNYELDRSLPKGRNKKLIELMKDKLDVNIMAKFVGLQVKTYDYLLDECSEDKKIKGTKNCAIKRKLTFENYKNCLEAN